MIGGVFSGRHLIHHPAATACAVIGCHARFLLLGGSVAFGQTLARTRTLQFPPLRFQLIDCYRDREMTPAELRVPTITPVTTSTLQANYYAEQCTRCTVPQMHGSCSRIHIYSTHSVWSLHPQAPSTPSPASSWLQIADSSHPMEVTGPFISPVAP